MPETYVGDDNAHAPAACKASNAKNHLIVFVRDPYFPDVNETARRLPAQCHFRMLS
jgi:hypothetical protein